MNPKAFGPLSTCLGGVAALLGGLAAALDLPTPVQVAMIVGAFVLLAGAGVLIGAAVAAQKKSGS